VQRPMPEPPPVTTTVWPANRPGRKAERYGMRCSCEDGYGIALAGAARADD
jgi:hypothetical protein